MSSANEKQVAGEHYKSDIQHWDYVVANELDYFQGQITKYVTRWKKKNGLPDLLKAQHFLEKYIELVENTLKELELRKSLEEAKAKADLQAAAEGEDDDVKQPKYDYNRNIADNEF